MMSATWLGDLLDRIALVWPCTRVESGSAAVFYRSGIAEEVLPPGIHCAIWWKNQVRAEKIAPAPLDLPTRRETTADGIEVSYSASLVYVVANLLKKQTRVQDFDSALETLAALHFARIIRSNTYEHVRNERGSIERAIRRQLARFAKAWGVRILDMSITDFTRAAAMHHMGDVVLHTNGSFALKTTKD